MCFHVERSVFFSLYIHNNNKKKNIRCSFVFYSFILITVTWRLVGHDDAYLGIPILVSCGNINIVHWISGAPNNFNRTCYFLLIRFAFVVWFGPIFGHIFLPFYRSFFSLVNFSCSFTKTSMAFNFRLTKNDTNHCVWLCFFSVNTSFVLIKYSWMLFFLSAHFFDCFERFFFLISVWSIEHQRPSFYILEKNLLCALCRNMCGVRSRTNNKQLYNSITHLSMSNQ